MPSQSSQRKRKSTSESSQVRKRQRRSPPYVNAIARSPRQGAFPAKMLVSMVYGDIIDLDPAAGGQANHVFRANGLFDPDVTGTGHQPRGFDQWMSAYKNFTVIGSKITAKCSSAAGTNTVDTLMSITCDNTTTPSGAIGILESATAIPGKSWSIFCPGNNEPLTLVQTYSHKKWFGKDYFEDEYKGSSLSDPAETCFYNISAQAMGVLDNPSGIAIAFQIEYTVMLFNPETLPVS